MPEYFVSKRERVRDPDFWPYAGSVGMLHILTARLFCLFFGGVVLPRASGTAAAEASAAKSAEATSETAAEAASATASSAHTAKWQSAKKYTARAECACSVA